MAESSPIMSMTRCTLVIRLTTVVTVSLLLVVPLARGSATQKPLTVANAIETTRVMRDENSRSIFARSVFPSPDGKRFVVMLIRGDIARDGMVVTLIAGGLASLDSAAQLDTVARFFTKGRSTSTLLTLPGANFPVWLDNERVALLWEDSRAVIQAVSVNVNTRETRYLTQHPTEVINYSVSPQGAVIYSAHIDYARARERSAELLHRGFSFTGRDVATVLEGYLDGSGVLDRNWNHERFVATAGHPQPRRIAVNRFPRDNKLPPWFSPDGHWAIAAESPSHVPNDWDQYTLKLFKEYILKQYRSDPDDGYARQMRQLFLINVEEATARPLWNAPTLGEWPPPKLHLAWGPDSRSVLMGPTFLPAAQADPAGLDAKAVAEVDVATGRYLRLPVPAGAAVRIRELRWSSESIVELSLEDGTSLHFRKRAGAWQPISAAQARRVARRQNSPLEARVQVELRQDLNTPPAFYAVERATGRERLILDLNPQLRTDFTLGRVEMVHWKDSDGRPWTGRLYYPVDHDQKRRYPLVIQTYGFAPATVFSLYGGGGNSPQLGPTYAIYLAQPLVNRQIAVLQVGAPDNGSSVVRSVSDIKMLTAGREAGVQHLAALGLIDPGKVGLMGFSAMGRQVEHAITFSDFPYAAAIAADHATHNYGESILYGTALNDFPDATPFGEQGLKAYLDFSPGFHAERVRTPLQMQYYGRGLQHVPYLWEMFTGLRHLKRPVEIYVVPDVEHGDHNLQNPRQLLAIQERALDWWCFWLKDEEDLGAAKEGQYAQWRKLREQRDAALKEPRPSILKWTATPIPGTGDNKTD